MSRRIYGIETEYGLTCASRVGGEPPITPEAAALELFAPIRERGRSTNVFLPNGGRLYLDVGSHPEYATAECDTIADVLAQDRAGSTFMADLARIANKSLAEREIPGVIHLFRNNADSRGNSYGCHENYLMRRTPHFRRDVDSLVPYFVSRQIVVGSGYLKLKRGRATYGFSQRADQTWDAVSSATTRSRPIINTRDEPHADAERYRRLHVIVGDTNVSEAATLAKIALTELVIGLAERGVLPRIELVDPMRAIREICQDIGGEVRVDVVGGGAMSAAHLQRRYLDAVVDADVAETREHRYAIDLWDRALTAIETGEWTPVETELDWVVKKKLLDAQARRGVTLESALASRLMLAYHDVTDAGLAATMEERGMLRRFTTPEQVAHAMDHPPATTRAHLRGRFLKAAERYRRDYTVDWTHVRLNDGTHPTLRLEDPFATSDARIDELIAELPRQLPEVPWC
ncbi:MAG: Pup--protein ligase [Bowdeniella nasicola]|nr:Pup--protein ligase [Bowdeniella nasicola]